MGRIQTRLSRSRRRRPLWRFCLRHVRLYHRLCRYCHWLDRTTGRLGQGETDTLEQIKQIEVALPFPLLGFDCDNGGEFLNYHLLRHFTKRQHPVDFTRSRAYHKDDNAHVEQKNWTHVRQWLGYQRLDDPRVVPLLNDLYTQEWRLFHNFFCPSMKLISKERVGSKTIKHHAPPKTPYQRTLESPNVLASVKNSLTKQGWDDGADQKYRIFREKIRDSPHLLLQ